MTHRLAIGFWLGLLAAAAVYVVMVAWSLPKIADAAGGLMPFDMRPLGYDLGEARAFVSALSPDGRAFYLSTQQWLDTLYPPLLALTLSLGLWIVAPAKSPFLRLPLIALAVLAMTADLAENALVRGLLITDAASFDHERVRMASAATLVKSLFTTAAMTFLLLFAALRGWRRWRRH